MPKTSQRLVRKITQLFKVVWKGECGKGYVQKPENCPEKSDIGISERMGSVGNGYLVLF